jgi:uncharacterized protein YacL (UPF0231 family)
VEIGVTPSKDPHGKFVVNHKLGHQVIGEEIASGIHFLLDRIEKEEKEAQKQEQTTQAVATEAQSA